MKLPWLLNTPLIQGFSLPFSEESLAQLLRSLNVIIKHYSSALTYLNMKAHAEKFRAAPHSGQHRQPHPDYSNKLPTDYYTVPVPKLRTHNGSQGDSCSMSKVHVTSELRQGFIFSTNVAKYHWMHGYAT